MQFLLTFLRKTIILILLLSIVPSLWAGQIDQKQVVAAVIVGEAGGEGRTGMLAVASVINNRMHKSGSTAYSIVIRPKQFDAYHTPVNVKEMSIEAYVNRAKKHPSWAYALELASSLEKGKCQDITEGATHFYSGGTIPYWAKRFAFTVSIGNHRFFRET